MGICDYLEKIEEAVKKLEQLNSENGKKKLLLAYRGEGKDYEETKLQPSLFRDGNNIDKEKHLLELLCDYNMISSDASNIEKAIESQHYIGISRMLDVSFDALVALYFACDHIEEDGFLYVFAFPKHYSPHSNYVENFYNEILSETNGIKQYSRNFKVFSHSHSNARIRAQKGGFIFFPGKNYYPINSCYYQKILVSKGDKTNILKTLEVLFQIHEAYIFPEKEKIASKIKENFIANHYEHEIVSVCDEIYSSIERVKYETHIAYTSNKKPSESILRRLRKERDDLLFFAKRHKQSECVINNIEGEFRFLNHKYGGI